jgi:hypothetical protein
MLLKIVCLLMRWLFGLTVLVCRGDGAKNAELLRGEIAAQLHDRVFGRHKTTSNRALHVRKSRE